MNLNYINNIPLSNNDPSVDQPNMQTNTNSIAAWVTQDHYGFNDNRGGIHKQVRLNSLSSIPPGLTGNVGTLYSKSVNTSVANEPTVFYSPSTTGNEYQITRTITGEFTLFGTNTQYLSPIDLSAKGGWTFLPGGMLFQYGFYSVVMSPTASAINIAIPFPLQFTNVPYSITATANASSILGIPQPITAILDGSVSEAGFTARIVNNANAIGTSVISVSWMAIGV
jgi:hypothetical protein